MHRRAERQEFECFVVGYFFTRLLIIFHPTFAFSISIIFCLHKYILIVISVQCLIYLKSMNQMATCCTIVSLSSSVSCG